MLFFNDSLPKTTRISCRQIYFFYSSTFLSREDLQNLLLMKGLILQFLVNVSQSHLWQYQQLAYTMSLYRTERTTIAEVNCRESSIKLIVIPYKLSLSTCMYSVLFLRILGDVYNSHILQI